MQNVLGPTCIVILDWKASPTIVPIVTMDEGLWANTIKAKGSEKVFPPSITIPSVKNPQQTDGPWTLPWVPQYCGASNCGADREGHLQSHSVKGHIQFREDPSVFVPHEFRTVKWYLPTVLQKVQVSPCLHPLTEMLSSFLSVCVSDPNFIEGESIRLFLNCWSCSMNMHVHIFTAFILKKYHEVSGHSAATINQDVSLEYCFFKNKYRVDDTSEICFLCHSN